MFVFFVLNQIVAIECMIIAPVAFEFSTRFVLGLFVLNEITLKVSLMITLVALKGAGAFHSASQSKEG